MFPFALVEVEGDGKQDRGGRILFLAPGAPICTQGQISDGGLREFALRRHLQVHILVTDRSDETALVRLAGQDGRAVFSTLEKGLAAVEQQAAFGLLCAGGVAGVAMLNQKRPNSLLEELLPGGVIGNPFRGRKRSGKCDREGKGQPDGPVLTHGQGNHPSRPLLLRTGRRIAKMARLLTAFGPGESPRSL